MMSDYLRLTMIMPFILNNFLKTSSLKENESKIILQRIDASHINMVKNVIISCWVHVAKTMRMVFESKFTLDSYDELQKCLKEEMIILPKVRNFLIFYQYIRYYFNKVAFRCSPNLLTCQICISIST